MADSKKVEDNPNATQWDASVEEYLNTPREPAAGQKPPLLEQDPVGTLEQDPKYTTPRTPDGQMPATVESEPVDKPEDHPTPAEQAKDKK
jgi:hypothetical protein